MIDWDEIDNIERETPKTLPRNNRKVPPSVDKVIANFDSNPVFTEENFHQSNEEIVQRKECDYLQEAYRATLRWQSLCRTFSDADH
jgi:hypothetical protein